MPASCPYCHRYPEPATALADLTLHRKPWGRSPALWISGPLAALLDAKRAGYITMSPSGWYVPTATYPGL
jgi:hypothetical protein